VDVLVTSDEITAGTFLVGDSQHPTKPKPIMAHYTRLLGFDQESGGVVLAEMLHPGFFGNAPTIEVSKWVFRAAWGQPEIRARYKPANVEDVTYWMMIISPPSGFPEDHGLLKFARLDQEAPK
jgi:hypothetical protein